MNPDDEDFDEDAVTDEERFLMDIGFDPEGDRMIPGQRRADNGAPWSPSDDGGADNGAVP